MAEKPYALNPPAEWWLPGPARTLPTAAAIHHAPARRVTGADDAHLPTSTTNIHQQERRRERAAERTQDERITLYMKMKRLRMVCFRALLLHFFYFNVHSLGTDVL